MSHQQILSLSDQDLIKTYIFLTSRANVTLTKSNSQIQCITNGKNLKNHIPSPPTSTSEYLSWHAANTISSSQTSFSQIKITLRENYITFIKDIKGNFTTGNFTQTHRQSKIITY